MADALPTSSGPTHPDLLPRREFLKRLGVAALAPASLSSFQVASPLRISSQESAAESAIRDLWESLTEPQKREVCFDWDYADPQRGLLRVFVANHWQVTRPCIQDPFFTRKQQFLIHDVFKNLVHPDWYSRFLRQLRDDTGGNDWGVNQSIAIFGQPGNGKFQFVITGRHLTLRADGHTEGHFALGGPILYGHAASGTWEAVHHPGNIFWPQAQQANKVFRLLEPNQQQQALVERLPVEEHIEFQPSARFPGLSVGAMFPEQKAEVEELLRALVAPLRLEDQVRIRNCLDKQGGLDPCNLTFYKEGDLGSDGEWDNWRLEGPAFVWYFRGFPHVHVWVNVADDPAVTITPRIGPFLFPGQDPLKNLPIGFPPGGNESRLS